MVLFILMQDSADIIAPVLIMCRFLARFVRLAWDCLFTLPCCILIYLPTSSDHSSTVFPCSNYNSNALPLSFPRFPISFLFSFLSFFSSVILSLLFFIPFLYHLPSSFSYIQLQDLEISASFPSGIRAELRQQTRFGAFLAQNVTGGNISVICFHAAISVIHSRRQ